MTLWWEVVNSKGKTGWQDILLTRKRCPDILVMWLTDSTWVNFDWSLSAKCHRLRVPLACFVTMATTGDEDEWNELVSFFSSLTNAPEALCRPGPELLETWFPDWLSSSPVSSASFATFAEAVGWGDWMELGPSKFNKLRKSKMWNGLKSAKWVLKVDASPKGTALGSLELNETCACRKEPGLYSSNQSTNLKSLIFLKKDEPNSFSTKIVTRQGRIRLVDGQHTANQDFDASL